MLHLVRVHWNLPDKTQHGAAGLLATCKIRLAACLHDSRRECKRQGRQGTGEKTLQTQPGEKIKETTEARRSDSKERQNAQIIGNVKVSRKRRQAQTNKAKQERHTQKDTKRLTEK
jgi:hypothetical protein